MYSLQLLSPHLEKLTDSEKIKLFIDFLRYHNSNSLSCNFLTIQEKSQVIDNILSSVFTQKKYKIKLSKILSWAFKN